MRKFSILLPTFDRPQFINRAVSSILAQDYENWELIIQNGGEPIVDVWDDERIKLFNEPDKGITDAMNKGWFKATGDIICWCNDDDEMNPGTLKWVDENLTKEWGYGLITMTNGNSPFTWGRIEPELGLKDLVNGNFVPQPAVFWRNDLIDKVGMMDESNDLTSDYEFWMRLWSHYEPQKFDRIMATYHIHPGQITITRTQEQVSQARKSAEKYA